MSEENLDIVIRAMGAALARQEQRRRPQSFAALYTVLDGKIA